MAAATRAGRHEHVGAGGAPSRRGADPAQRLRRLDPGLLGLVKALRLIGLLWLTGLLRLRRLRGLVAGLHGLRGLRELVAGRLGLPGPGGTAGGDELVRAIDQPPAARRRGLVGVRATAGAALGRRFIGHGGGERRKLPRRRAPGGIPCRAFLGRRDRRGRRRVFLIA
ncbi:hypothetical protein [Microtetraspora malaysiensis]|uniref:hypothetical protein n=1 Tax=Microtetraspora malaysiensis TaxID=161358 RepID=UPI003D8BC941